MIMLCTLNHLLLTNNCTLALSRTFPTVIKDIYALRHIREVNIGSLGNNPTCVNASWYIPNNCCIKHQKSISSI